MKYNLIHHLLQVKPLIWIESVIEKFSHSRVEIMVKVLNFVYFKLQRQQNQTYCALPKTVNTRKAQ